MNIDKKHASQNQLSANDRRSFLAYVVAILSAVGAFMVAWGVGRFVLFTAGGDKRREVRSQALKSLQEDVPLHVPEAGAWLVKPRGSDSVLALDDRCTHLGCRQKWNPEKSSFECPCHGSEFDLQGMVKRGPATRPLLRLSITQEQGDTLLLVERRGGV